MALTCCNASTKCGQIIYSESVNASSYKKDVDLSNYSKGVYSLKVVSDGEVVSRKVVYK
ncbi:MAG: T9SS type A sorting domain-containing protein [Bacteroidia bacterium]|nr:T9SS type A sorting domain-containing protein [Bacteroidia bacterium]